MGPEHDGARATLTTLTTLTRSVFTCRKWCNENTLTAVKIPSATHSHSTSFLTHCYGSEHSNKQQSAGPYLFLLPNKHNLFQNKHVLYLANPVPEIRLFVNNRTFFAILAHEYSLSSGSARSAFALISWAPSFPEWMSCNLTTGRVGQ